MISPVGPNGTYGSGGKVKGSFGGFQPEYAPGQIVSKVEVAMKLYISASLTSTESPKISAYVNGSAGALTTVTNTGLNGCVGAAKVCTTYVDITASRAWKWSDFKTLQVMINQTTLANGKTIYYDAVGLRITTADGSDGTTPLSVATSSDTGPTDASVLANVYPKVIRATDAWNTAPYYQGSGVTVAVVDSGSFKDQRSGYAPDRRGEFQLCRTYSHG